MEHSPHPHSQASPLPELRWGRGGGKGEDREEEDEKKAGAGSDHFTQFSLPILSLVKLVKFVRVRMTVPSSFSVEKIVTTSLAGSDCRAGRGGASGHWTCKRVCGYRGCRLTVEMFCHSCWLALSSR